MSAGTRTWSARWTGSRFPTARSRTLRARGTARWGGRASARRRASGRASRWREGRSGASEEGKNLSTWFALFCNGLGLSWSLGLSDKLSFFLAHVMSWRGDACGSCGLRLGPQRQRRLPGRTARVFCTLSQTNKLSRENAENGRGAALTCKQSRCLSPCLSSQSHRSCHLCVSAKKPHNPRRMGDGTPGKEFKEHKSLSQQTGSTHNRKKRIFFGPENRATCLTA